MEHLRSGNERDAAQVARLFEEVRATMPYVPRLHDAQETRRYFAQQLREQQSLVFVEEAQLLGFAIYEEGWLHHLYVRRRNRGTGSVLLRAVKAQVENGLQLWTFRANEGAQRFYERHGFVAVEETDGAANEERLPDVRYVWSRNSG